MPEGPQVLYAYTYASYEYVYNYTSGSDYEIISYGADGSPGGVDEDADLSSKTINQDGP